ncbi:DUF1489 family protein [Sphingosinicella rhizophila]|uniref:DUF1489 domain-containing protein n=1 Tax=Sphingosinicella rhizophila TaxID=3050082 RepID=A0ABU3Q9J5_9SPHN|nr:DUF1489 domain-containing protein [Sphingosinicella sp. GR2756]MDT9599668.1 DUF1489 domain-containing protein [Sphingosinicella sp. GR2756]
MALLHISKVAVGCASFEALRKRQQARLIDNHVPIVTRFRPKRADELVGGSIFWIVKHRIAARQTIIGFAEREEDRRTIIRLDPCLIPVKARPKRAHQGWRYLAGSDAPADFDGEEDGLEQLPPDLAVKLSALALI